MIFVKWRVDCEMDYALGKVRVTSLYFVCVMLLKILNRVCSRIFERRLWWYDCRVIKTLARWCGTGDHRSRYTWYFESCCYSSRLRVTSMQSNGCYTIWWMLSRRVSRKICLIVLCNWNGKIIKKLNH